MAEKHQTNKESGSNSKSAVNRILFLAIAIEVTVARLVASANIRLINKIERMLET